jgi:hypothetical protein
MSWVLFGPPRYHSRVEVTCWMKNIFTMRTCSQYGRLLGIWTLDPSQTKNYRVPNGDICYNYLLSRLLYSLKFGTGIFHDRSFSCVRGLQTALGKTSHFVGWICMVSMDGLLYGWSHLFLK